MTLRVEAVLIISFDIYCRNNQTVELLNQVATIKTIILHLLLVELIADLMFIEKVRKEGSKSVGALY
jgi:hypothetical protein